MIFFLHTPLFSSFEIQSLLKLCVPFFEHEYVRQTKKCRPFFIEGRSFHN